MEQSRKGDCKMKKFLCLLCMITCVFGLTACGSTETYTQYEQDKMEIAKRVATEAVIPCLNEFNSEETQKEFAAYTAEEITAVMQTIIGIEVDGYAFRTAMESFNSAYETIGAFVSAGEATAKIDGKQIVVSVPIVGEKKNAEAEVILSNDVFTRLESASLNPTASMSDMMGKAALNTLIGMGTVFVVLILISLIISCFSLIPKIQAAFSKKNEKEETKSTGVDNAVSQIVVQEESDETDDLELVAVIAAAIAASEGAASTDGFVVRSIRKVR